MITIQEFRKLKTSDQALAINSMSENEAASLLFDWLFWARPDQLQPEELGAGGKFIWFAKAGRGYGKTRMFAEWVIDKVKNHGYGYISLAGAAADEVRDIMIEGESGILACSPPWFMPVYEPSKKRIEWPNGARASIFYGTEPDKARGAQSDLIWADEIAKWKYPQDTFDNLLLGLRLGKNPLCGVSSTPKPTKFIKELAARDDVIVTCGSTFDNVGNLAKPFIDTILRKYKGTRLERQEIFAQILDDNPGALWHRHWIEQARVTRAPDLFRLVVAVDPAASSNEDSAETGIIVVGKGPALVGMKMMDQPHYYVLEDLTITGTPSQWAQQAVSGHNKYRADRIIAEKNNGGDMVASTISNVDPDVKVDLVWASRGKVTRAEPISALYEQGRVHHVGTFGDLEDQLCEWQPGAPSPDRMDALVWGISSLHEIQPAGIPDVDIGGLGL